MLSVNIGGYSLLKNSPDPETNNGVLADAIDSWLSQKVSTNTRSQRFKLSQ